MFFASCGFFCNVCFGLFGRFLVQQSNSTALRLKWKTAIYQVHKLFTIWIAAYTAATRTEGDSPMLFIRGATVLWDTTYQSKDTPERWAYKNLNPYKSSHLFIAKEPLFLPTHKCQGKNQKQFETFHQTQKFQNYWGDVMRHHFNFTKFPNFGEENHPHQHAPPQVLLGQATKQQVCGLLVLSNLSLRAMSYMCKLYAYTGKYTLYIAYINIYILYIYAL